MQNLLFLPSAMAETIVSTHCSYAQWDGQAEWPGNTRTLYPPKVVTNPSTNQAQRSSSNIVVIPATLQHVWSNVVTIRTSSNNTKYPGRYL